MRGGVGGAGTSLHVCRLLTTTIARRVTEMVADTFHHREGNSTRGEGATGNRTSSSSSSSSSRCCVLLHAICGALFFSARARARVHLYGHTRSSGTWAIVAHNIRHIHNAHVRVHVTHTYYVCTLTQARTHTHTQTHIHACTCAHLHTQTHSQVGARNILTSCMQYIYTQHTGGGFSAVGAWSVGSCRACGARSCCC